MIIGKNKNNSDVIQYIINNLIKKDRIELFGPKNSGKNIIHVSEAVKAVYKAISVNKKLEENIINVGSSDLISSLEMCNHIGDKLKIKPNVSFLKNNLGVNFNLDVLNSNIINYKCKSAKTNLDMYLEELF